MKTFKYAINTAKYSVYLEDTFARKKVFLKYFQRISLKSLIYAQFPGKKQQKLLFVEKKAKEKSWSWLVESKKFSNTFFLWKLSEKILHRILQFFCRIYFFFGVLSQITSVFPRILATKSCLMRKNADIQRKYGVYTPYFESILWGAVRYLSRIFWRRKNFLWT